MAVVPINLARVSQNMQAFNLLGAIRRNQLGLFRVQNQLATGLRINQPSDDPVGAAAASVMDRRLDEVQQLQRNLLHANSGLAQGEAAMQDAVNLIAQVQNIASQAVGDSATPDERKALAPAVDSVLDQLVAVGNRKYLESYLFAGQYTADQPFGLVGDGVIYRGDDGRLSTIVDTDMQQDSFTMPGSEFFGAVSTAVHGIADLNPAVTADTRISDLRGTTGQGVTLGRIAVSTVSQQVEIDLSGAATVGDLVDRLNAGLPPNLHAALGTDGITISADLGGPTVITITDVDGGQTARDLGLTADGLGLPVGGGNLDPRLTQRTWLGDLYDGVGVDMTHGLTIENGNRSVTLDFAGAQTIEDVLNTMNQADVGVWARLADDGRSIEVLNRVSGASLSIQENGGGLATALGIRSLNYTTELAKLNDGRGVQTVDGNDLRIVTANGAAFEVDLDGARTLQDVVRRISLQSGGSVSAGLATNGNGIMLTDNTAGSETFRVERANLSPALDGLGLDVSAVGNRIIGRDVNPIRVDSPFTALQELRDGLSRDDRQEIAWAGQRLDRTLKALQQVQGQMAAQARAMDDRTTQMDNETTATQVLLSNLRDVDIADAVVRFQQMQTALQANLTTSSRIMNLSLLDYLR